MVKNIYPTRAEANDIFNCLESGADGSLFILDLYKEYI